MSEPVKKVSGHGDLVDEIVHLLASVEYWKQRCAEAEGIVGLEITSIPLLIAKNGGNLERTTRETGINNMTVRRHRFDRKCEAHMIVNGMLFSKAKGSKPVNVK